MYKVYTELAFQNCGTDPPFAWIKTLGLLTSKLTYVQIKVTIRLRFAATMRYLQSYTMVVYVCRKFCVL